MERRKAIKNIGLSFGAMVATPSIISLLQSCQAQETPWTPTFYTQEQGKFVKTLIDTFLPPSGDLPGALGINVHVFVDKFVSECVSVDDKPNHRDGLDRSMNALLKLSGEENINDVEDGVYVEFLENRLRKSKEEHEATMKKIYTFIGAYAEKDTPPDFREMDDELSIYQFLTQMRDLSIWAYKISEQVGEKVMAYKPIPGKQQGCVDLQATTGGMAWSLG